RGNDLRDQCPTPGHGKHPEYTDCGRFMHAVFSPDDPSFPESGTGSIGPHVQMSESPVRGMWCQLVYPGYKSGKLDLKAIQRVDILVRTPSNSQVTGHTALHGGENIAPDTKKPNGYVIYDASFGDYDPDHPDKGGGHPPKRKVVRNLSEFQIYARPNP